MLTFTQLKVLKARRRKLTQEQMAQILNIEAARKFVCEEIEKAIAANPSRELSGADLDRVYRNQPVHFDDMGYIPHWFKREDIIDWAWQIRRKFIPAIMKRNVLHEKETSDSVGSS